MGVVSGEKAVYENWASGEPNNQSYAEDYAMFYSAFTDGTWNDGRFDGTAFICEWDTIDSDQYMIQIVDENGDPLEGASVTFDGETAQTGADGMVLFDAFTFGNPVIEVSLDGYMKWTNQD